MKRFTVTWERGAKAELARLWTDNKAIQGEIAAASDEIDRLLAIAPLTLGETVSTRSRQYVEPPLKVLFAVSEPDCLVRVIYVKLWEY
jgi:hypothetical protein